MIYRIEYGWKTFRDDVADTIATDPEAISLGGNGFAIFGGHLGHVDGQTFDPGGFEAGGLLNVPGSNASAAALTNGNIVLVTQDSDSILYSILAPDGTTVMAPVDINDSASSNADVAALANGGFVIANQDNFGTENDIDVRVYNSAGTLQSSFVVDNSIRDDVDPSVVGLANGNIAVAWTRNVDGESEIWTAVFGPGGSVVKAASMFATVHSINRNASLAATDAGFAMVYESNSYNLGTIDVPLTTFDISGNFLNEILVSHQTGVFDGSNDLQPALTKLSNGMLAVSWSDNTNSDTDIELALIDANGSAVLARQTLNQGQSIGDDVEGSSLAAFGLGRVVVAAENLTDGTVNFETLSAVRRIYSGSDGDAIIAPDDMDHELVGLGGADLLRGGSGDDVLDGGHDNDRLEGGDGDDILIGSYGNDTLVGGKGVDGMSGGAGNDVYVVEDGHDLIIEHAGQGTDLVNASVGHTLAANIEKLTLAGSANISGTGNNLNNAIKGNGGSNSLYGLGGNDTLDGQGGADYMEGGLGNDSYVVDNGGDQVVEDFGAGTDTVKASITHSLAANVENLVLTGKANLNGTGNGGNNKITGNAGNNTLSGGAGNDTLLGGKGNDLLLGGDGLDLLTGGAGQDTLTGGAGNDRFIFVSAADSGGGYVDVITDFVGGQDKIDLTKIDANILGGAPGDQAFTFIGTSPFAGTGSSSAGQLRYEQVGGETRITGDMNGDGVVDFMIKLDDLVTLAGTDFLL